MSNELEPIAPSAIESQERAQIDVQIATARRYPRELKLVKQKMLAMATLDQETAAACFYTLKREGKKIQGPSVRLAEIAVAAYGHIRAASRVVGNDGKKLTCQGVCIDLENNVAVSVEVERRITNKEGRTYSDDMQIVTANAGNAIAFRNAVFKVVPGALIKPVYEQVVAVAIGDAKSLKDRWYKAVDAFSKMGVSADQLFCYLNRKGEEDLTVDDIQDLLGLYNAIRDGETTLDEAFSQAGSTGSAEAQQKAANEKLAQMRQPQKGDMKPEERKQPEAAKIDEEHQLQLLQLAESLGVKQDALKQVVDQRGFKALHTITEDKYAAIVQDLKDAAAHKNEPAEDRTPEPGAADQAAGTETEKPKQKLTFGKRPEGK